MKPEKSTSVRANFLNRRYAVQLGRRYILAAAGMVFVSLMGCTQVKYDNSTVAEAGPPPQQTSRTKQTQPPVAVNSKVVAANTKFGFKLFNEILKADSDKNVFVSPASVATALAMTYNGAKGETQQAIAKTLELQGLTLADINNANAALQKVLQNPDPKVQLAVANSLWVRQGFAVSPEFLQRNRNYYGAEVANLNFDDAQAPNIINNWVKQKTQGKIDEIVNSIAPEQMLYLINAVYFKGAWTEPFDKQQTTNQPFYLASGQTKQHPMMSKSGKYNYLETNNFQAISLPYGKNGRMSMYVFLPKQNSNLAKFQQSLNSQSWDKWMTQFSKQPGSIRLPRFKMDYDVKLNDALKALGMGVAFQNQANFTGIAPNLAISEVKHKTFVEVNEEGTEAAATTSVGIVATSAPIRQPFQMMVDRPFFTAIRDNQTGTVLFMGSIVEPRL